MGCLIIFIMMIVLVVLKRNCASVRSHVVYLLKLQAATPIQLKRSLSILFPANVELSFSIIVSVRIYMKGEDIFLV